MNNNLEAKTLLNLYKRALQAADLICWEWDINTNSITVTFPKPVISPLNIFLKNIHPEDIKHFRNDLSATLTKEIYYEHCFRLIGPKGVVKRYCGRGRLIKNKNKEAIKVIGVWILEDAQSKKILSQRVSRIMHTAQICSMRELASMFSHQISQPLTVINTYLSGCVNMADSPKSKNTKVMKKIIKQVELAGKLLHDLKNNIRKTKLIYTYTNLNHLIELAVGWVMPEDPDSHIIQIIYDFDTSLPLIEIDMTQIKIAIINLLNNGVEAIQEAGIKKPKLRITTKKIDQNNICLLIEDNGKGIPSSIERNLFTSCLSMKEKKIGMGLATCRGIIDEHNGSISYQRIRNTTCFKVTLPIKQTNRIKDHA